MGLSREKFLELFGYRLSLARSEARVSQKEVAKVCGVTPITVSRWEKGESAPTAWALSQVMELTGKGSEWFIRGVSGEVVAGAERELVRLYRLQSAEGQAAAKAFLSQSLAIEGNDVRRVV